MDGPFLIWRARAYYRMSTCIVRQTNASPRGFCLFLHSVGVGIFQAQVILKSPGTNRDGMLMGRGGGGRVVHLVAQARLRGLASPTQLLPSAPWLKRGMGAVLGAKSVSAGVRVIACDPP